VIGLKLWVKSWRGVLDGFAQFLDRAVMEKDPSGLIIDMEFYGVLHLGTGRDRCWSRNVGPL